MGYAFNKNIACVYIYFDYKDQKRQDLTNLLSSLLAQLVRNRDQISQETKAKHDNWMDRGINPSSDEYLAMLISQIKSFDRVFIVIDALDECVDNPETNTRNNFLKAIQQLPQRVHILFTSRPVISIEQRVKADRQLEIVANNDDLRKYLESRINAFENLRHLVDIGVQKDSSFLDNILRTIVKKSQGMQVLRLSKSFVRISLTCDLRFLLAKLHIEFLASTHRLVDFQTGIEHLPPTPDEVYTISLERIRGQRDEFKRSLAISALTWLVFAERALTITELKHALDLKVYDENLSDERFATLLTSACAGIVVVDGSANTVRLAHYTAEEYLRKNKSTIFQDPQSKMAETCLIYLSLNEFGQVPRLQSKVEDRCTKYPFLRYAADHWGNHVSFGVRGPVYMLAWKFLSNGQKLKSAIQVMTNFCFRHEIDVSGLHVAAYFGLSELVERAIKLRKCFSMNARTQRGETALHWAVIYRQRQFLELLISQGADLNVTDTDRKTALHKAIINGDVLSVEVLLSLPRRVDLKLEDSQGYTPLRWAAAYGQMRVVEMLLESGADINAQDKDGWTALRWAAQRGHKRIVELLVQNRASLETSSISDQDQKWTLLRWAAREGREPFIQLLIERQVDLNETDSDSNEWTAIRWAIDYGHGMTAWLLMQAGADVNKPDQKGFTPLHSAAEKWQESSDKSLIWLLLENGAEINARTKLGRTALHIAASRGHVSLAWLFLEKGANPSRVDNNGRTALHCAITEGHKSVAQLLIRRDRSLTNATDDEKRTGLHVAASAGDLPIVMLLADSGAVIDVRDREGYTPLHRAVSQQHQDVVRFLVKRGADANIPNKKKCTAMQSADSTGNTALMKAILQSDEAGTRVKNKEGVTTREF
jgi:ankyrin repeat protein